MVDRLLGEGVWNGQVILREIQDAGYWGQRSILRDYIRRKRPLRTARATSMVMPGAVVVSVNMPSEPLTRRSGRRSKGVLCGCSRELGNDHQITIDQGSKPCRRYSRSSRMRR